MKRKWVDYAWGALLILLGGFFLANNLEIIPEPSVILWAGLFAAASLFFFGVYAVSGPRDWGWLFPALVTAAIAAIIVLAETGRAGPFLGSLVLWAVSIPFLAAFLANRHENWWALIPGWATAVLGTIVLLSDAVAGELIGALVMLSIGLPFFVVYLVNREHWWALIPGFVVSGIGVSILFATRLRGEFVGAFVLFAIALPFLAIYLFRREHWWALIPGGILVSVGLTAFLSGFNVAEVWQERLLGSVIFLGAAVTFTILWLQRDRQPTAWAKYPALGLAIIALIILATGSTIEYLWPLALIIAGLWLLYDNMVRPPTLKS